MNQMNKSVSKPGDDMMVLAILIFNKTFLFFISLIDPTSGFDEITYNNALKFAPIKENSSFIEPISCSRNYSQWWQYVWRF